MYKPSGFVSAEGWNSRFEKSHFYERTLGPETISRYLRLIVHNVTCSLS